MTFNELTKVDVSDHLEKKNGLNYLSWAWAWDTFKKQCPDAMYEIWKDEHGRPYIYDENLGYMVFVKVMAMGEEHEMWLPVMDGANNAMKATQYTYTVKNKDFKYATWDAERQGYYDKYGNEQKQYIDKTVEAATMFDINTAIMRCLVKCIAIYGLGLYIYAGEDVPKASGLDPLTEQEKKALEMFCKRLKINIDDVLKLYQAPTIDSLNLGQFSYIMSHEEDILKGVKG